MANRMRMVSKPKKRCLELDPEMGHIPTYKPNIGPRVENSWNFFLRTNIGHHDYEAKFFLGQHFTVNRGMMMARKQEKRAWNWPLRGLKRKNYDFEWWAFWIVIPHIIMDQEIDWWPYQIPKMVPRAIMGRVLAIKQSQEVSNNFWRYLFNASVFPDRCKRERQLRCKLRCRLDCRDKLPSTGNFKFVI